jgi:TRAP-type uncharacterized transport system substrate-binding protein
MPKVLKHTLLSVREMLITGGPFLLLTVLLLVLAYVLLKPTPPKRVVLATGVAQGAYAEFGKRYAERLKRYGITVELRETQGAAENLALLRDPHSGVDIALVQGGADRQRRAEARRLEAEGTQAELVSLGSLFYEPVWLFYRADSAARLLKAPPHPKARNPAPSAAKTANPAPELTSLTQLQGWRVNVGPPGSGVPVLMDKLFEANKLDAQTLDLIEQSQTPAVVDLLEGRLDALVFASAPESLMVQLLLQSPGIKLFDFGQAEAYSRRFPFMSAVRLPRGVVDLARDIPPADVHLVAPTASLVAKADTHPALLQLFMQAAKAVHGDAGWFQRKGEFPNPGNTEQPLAAEAQRYYQSGTPLLQHYLPFWLANLIDRMWPVLVSIIAVLIPLSRLLPPVYEFRIRSRIFRWYAQLRAVEEAQNERPADELVRELGELDDKVGRITVPLSHADELYALRGHINLVRRRLLGAEGEAPRMALAGENRPA